MRALCLILCALALGTASCITLATPVPVNPTPLFVTATLPATRTPYAKPTVTPTAATPKTPIPTAEGTCSLRAR